MKSFLLVSAAVFGAITLAGAQSIEIGELSGAESYEPGTLTLLDGALGNHLWTGTRADTAKKLMAGLPQSYENNLARGLVRSVLLSPGAPPHGTDENQFSANRINAIIRLSELAAAQDIAARTPGLASSRELQADMALLSGAADNACGISDSIVDARREPYWMRLRAFCHAKRGETAAADLTLDLLSSTGDADKGFSMLMRRLTGVPGKPNFAGVTTAPLSIAMMNEAGLDWPKGKEPAAASAQRAFNPLASPNDRLAAMLLSAHALSDSQLSQIIEGLAQPDPQNSDALAGGAPMIDEPKPLADLLEDSSAAGFAELYKRVQYGDFQSRLPALIELLGRADQAGRLDRFAMFLEPHISAISYIDLAPKDILLMARTAVYRKDIGGLQQIHNILDNAPRIQDRVALAADALGNGFYGGSLGIDIDTRLANSGEAKSRALRDALIAHALGAELSGTGLESLENRASYGRLGGDLVVLNAAARKRAKAETALRAALILEKGGSTLPDLTLYRVIQALYDAGLQDHAGKIAALDFLADIPE